MGKEKEEWLINCVTLVGRLVRDPSVREGQNTSVCSMTVAVDREFKKDETDFISVKCFGNQAKSCGDWLQKGSLVSVRGTIQTGSYIKKDGTKVYTTDVIAERIGFLGGKKERNNEQYEGFHEYSGDDENIPF